MALFRGIDEIKKAPFVVSAIFPRMERTPLIKAKYEETFLYTLLHPTLARKIFESA